MKNFNELFETAEQTADRRKKVFNQLIERTKNEILPRFCEACEGFDLKTVYFRTYNMPVNNIEAEADYHDEREPVYYTAIHINNKSVTDAQYDLMTGQYIVPAHWEGVKIEDAEFTRTGIIEFIKALNNRLDNYIERYEKKIEEANELMK